MQWDWATRLHASRSQQAERTHAERAEVQGSLRAKRRLPASAIFARVTVNSVFFADGPRPRVTGIRQPAAPQRPRNPFGDDEESTPGDRIASFPQLFVVQAQTRVARRQIPNYRILCPHGQGTHDMEWSEETIVHLRALWADGHSTAEIGRRLGVSKNAVVGKAHRLDLPARPSPIRRDGPGPRQPRRSVPRTTGPTLPPLASTQHSAMLAHAITASRPGRWRRRRACRLHRRRARTVASSPAAGRSVSREHANFISATRNQSRASRTARNTPSSPT